jgi:hypothetical protein
VITFNPVEKPVSEVAELTSEDCLVVERHEPSTLLVAKLQETCKPRRSILTQIKKQPFVLRAAKPNCEPKSHDAARSMNGRKDRKLISSLGSNLFNLCR